MLRRCSVRAVKGIYILPLCIFRGDLLAPCRSCDIAVRCDRSFIWRLGFHGCPPLTVVAIYRHIHVMFINSHGPFHTFLATKYSVDKCHWPMCKARAHTRMLSLLCHVIVSHGVCKNDSTLRIRLHFYTALYKILICWYYCTEMIFGRLSTKILKWFQSLRMFWEGCR